MQATGSRTAKMVAVLRGRAGVDPFGEALGGAQGAIDADRYEASSPQARLYMDVRTRFFDAAVQRGISDGIDQIVIVGAGCDTRAMRLAQPGVTFFEVDHPATGAAKRAQLETIEGYDPDVAVYVGCDFEAEDFVTRLAEAGFVPARPAVFVWEGVTYYLTEAAVRATLRRVAACDPESRLYFDTVSKRFVAGAVRDAEDLAARDQVAEMGEPMRFGIDDVVPLLYREGFRHIRTVSFDEACLSFHGTYERERKFRFQSLVEARVSRFFYSRHAPA